MNFRILVITRKFATNYYKYPLLNQIVPIQTRNYYCEEYEKKQKIKNKLENDLITAESLKFDDKDFFFYNKFKKILEQNNKILIQNEKILSSITELQTNTTNTTNTNEIELLKKYITKEQYEI